MKMLSWIKSQDNLGSNIGFTINSNNTYNTSLGGFLSIFLFILKLYFFLIFSEDMLKKTNPIGYDQTKPNPKENLRLNFSNSYFLGGFLIEDYHLNVLNLTEHFYPIFEYHESNNKENTKTEVGYITCDKHQFKVEGLRSSTDRLGDYYCPDLKTIYDKKLFGDFYDKEYGILTFRLSLCNVDKTECKDLKKVWDFFENNEVFISSVIPKSEYFIADNNKPFDVKLMKHYSFLSNRNLLMEDYTFQRKQLEEDTGSLFENVSIREHLSLKEMTNLNDVRGTEFLQKDIKNTKLHRYVDYYHAEIFYDSNFQYYNRRYLKLFEVFANVGGMMDFISFWFIIVISYYSKKRLDSYVCQRLLYIEDEKEKNFNGKILQCSLDDVERNKKKLKSFLTHYSKNNLNKKNIQNKKDSIIDQLNKSKNHEVENRKSIYYLDQENLKIDFNNSQNFEKINSKYSKVSNFDNSINDINNVKKIDENENEKFNKESELIYRNDNQNKIEMIELKNSNNNNKNKNINYNNNNDLNENDNDNENKSKSKNESFIEIDLSQRKILQKEKNNENNNASNIDESKKNDNFDNDNSNNNYKADNKKNIKNDNSKELENDNLDIKDYLEISINKFRNYKNSLQFQLHSFFIYCLFSKKNKNYSMIDLYCEKIYKNFDIFYYMQNQKKSEFMQKLLYNNKQNRILDLISAKCLRISYENYDKEEIEENIIDIDDEIIKYILDVKNIAPSDEQINIITNFIN